MGLSRDGFTEIVTTGEFAADIRCDARRVAAYGRDRHQVMASCDQACFQRRDRWLALAALDEQQRGAGYPERAASLIWASPLVALAADAKNVAAHLHPLFYEVVETLRAADASGLSCQHGL